MATQSNTSEENSGNNLRDQFASSALNGLLAAVRIPAYKKVGRAKDYYETGADFNDYARIAYGLADAMLLARHKSLPKQKEKSPTT